MTVSKPKMIPVRRPNSGAPQGQFTAEPLLGMPDTGHVVRSPDHVPAAKVAGSKRRLNRKATFQLMP